MGDTCTLAFSFECSELEFMSYGREVRFQPSSEKRQGMPAEAGRGRIPARFVHQTISGFDPNNLPTLILPMSPTAPKLRAEPHGASCICFPRKSG